MACSLKKSWTWWWFLNWAWMPITRWFFSNCHNLTKKGYVIKNYQQCLNSEMFRLKNDITWLLVGCISLLGNEVQANGQCIMLLLLAFKAICDDKLKSRQGQSPLSLVLIQNTSYYEILQVFMVWIHNDFTLSCH